MCFLKNVCRLVVVCMIVVRSHCRHQHVLPYVAAVVLALSVIILFLTDPPHLPLPRSSPTICSSGKPWTMMMDRPRRVSRTSTVPQCLHRACCPCSSPSSLSLSSSSKNAPLKVGGGRPPRNHARTPPLPRRRRRHPPS